MITTITSNTLTAAATNFLSYAWIPMVALMAFIGLKEVLGMTGAGRYRYKSLLSLLNIVIPTLLIVFIFLIAYKTTNLI